MRFTPLNGHVEVRLIIEGGIIARHNEKYEEKGTVVSWDPELTSGLLNKILKVGDIVFFDGWLCAKYPIGDTDEYRYLVKFEDIRGKETHD